MANLTHDLLIAGGGINGAALARLAAFQGLKVALFESDDFGHGASSNTSKLLHGGLRYLETYDFSLVRDATHERAQLLEIAPHLVSAARFLFPKTRLGRHGRMGIKAGLMLYDFLAGGLRIRPHRWLTPAALTRMEPNFLPLEACGAYEYSDCIMDDARLVMENLVDARSMGAELHNYQRLLGVERAADGILEVTVLDRLSGKERVHRAKRVALTLGPWTDQFALKAFPAIKPQARLSQGIHLIVDGLESQACFILPVPKSRRYFFVLPWKGKHLIGTTETEVGDFPPESAEPQAGEIEELLALLKVYFPGQTPGMICTITGIRPLARASGGTTITLSREHAFHRLADGVFSVVGGKYTTHRTLAEKFLEYMYGREFAAKDIKSRILPGAWKDIAGRTQLEIGLDAFPFVDPAIKLAWIRRYGMRALELAEYARTMPGGQERLPGLEPILLAEVAFSQEREWAKTPEDFFRRRTDIYFTRDGGVTSYDRVREFFTLKNPAMEKMLGGEADYLGFLRRNRHHAVG